jgi:phosphoglycolate phosphatase-like HAD superfamily hydrolase
VKAAALDLDAVLGDTRALWTDWLEDAARRMRVELGDVPVDRVAAARVLDERLGNWRALLERFAEDRAPLYLRPSPDANALLRRLQAAGVRLGAFTDAPVELARVALGQLGAARRIDAVGTLEDVRRELGDGAVVVRSPAELADLGARA